MFNMSVSGYALIRINGSVFSNDFKAKTLSIENFPKVLCFKY